MASLQQIIAWFQTGLFPTADQFKQTWLSYWHKSEKIPQSQIFGLKETIESATRGLIYQDPVPTKSALDTTYPNAKVGWASMVQDEGYIYSFNGTSWANTGLEAFPDDVATKDDLASLERNSTGYILQANITYDSENKKIYIKSSGANFFFYIAISNGGYFTFSGTGEYVMTLEPVTEYYVDTKNLSNKAFTIVDIISRKVTSFIDLTDKILLLRTDDNGNPHAGFIFDYLNKLTTDSSLNKYVQSLNVQVQALNSLTVEFTSGKNLFNQTGQLWKTGGYYQGGVWVVSAGFLATALMLVNESDSYCISPHPADIYNYCYCVDKDGNYIGNASVVVSNSSYVTYKTIPNTAYMSLCMAITLFNTYKSQVQVEKGSAPTAYEPYVGSNYIKFEKVAGLSQLAEEVKNIDTDFIEEIKPVFVETRIGKNLFNKDANPWKTGGYYQGGVWVVSAGFLATALMLVNESDSYCISPHPADIYNYCYCVDKDGNYIGNASVVVSNSSYVTYKTIPNTAYMSLCMAITLFNTYKSQVQVEKGSAPTAYEPYEVGEFVTTDRVVGLPELITKVNDLDSRIPSDTVSSVFPQPQYPGASSKFSKFRDIMLKRNQDAIVVITGTSLSQGSTWASTRVDATTRPPVLHTNDFASAVYNKLIQYWTGQESRRYDHSFFTLIGLNWSVKNSDTAWDDNTPVHNGLTKLTSDANAGVSFIVPSDAFRFNFIYRTDSTGDTCTISIAEGNGKMELFDGVNWVEANGFQFSMLEPAATSTKGNTCYQKRLDMRCKNRYSDIGINSIGIEKNVTIKKGNNTDKRFLFAGVEWSKREFILQVINSSRGSGNWGAGDGANSNQRYQDSDIWIHNPNLLLAEITTHNWGANAYGNEAADPTTYLNLCKRWYFNAFNDQPNSIYARTNGYTTCDVIFYNDTFNGARNNNGPWDENGNIKWGVVTTNGDYKGVSKTCYENYDIIDEYMRGEQSQYAFVALNPNFKKVCEQFFGKFSDGLVASGMTGVTLVTDGTHWNDNGAALVADVILPLFDFM